MIIGVDIDEVLADMTTFFVRFHNENYNTNVTRKDIHSFDLWKVVGGTQEDMARKFYEFYASKHFFEMTTVFGSQKHLKSLSEKHEIHLITARPDDIKKETESWIKKHFPFKEFEIHFTNHWGKGSGNERTKGQICEELKIEIMIEDSLAYAKDIAQKGIKVLLMDCPWNQTKELPVNIIRIFSWEEAIKKIENGRKTN